MASKHELHQKGLRLTPQRELVLAANAILTWGMLAYLIFRYSHKQPFEGIRLTWSVAIITTGVCLASLYRNTHWFSDLLGGLFIGSALLVLIIAIDRSISSNRQPS